MMMMIVCDDDDDNHSSVDTHNLKVIVYSTLPFRRVHQGPLPLSHRATLKWIGFTREGLLAAYDSQCVMRILTGVAVGEEELMYDEMEWVVLMNVKSFLKEKQERGEARMS